MQHIQDFMAGDHRHCDTFFAEAGRAMASRQWGQALTAYEQFQALVLQHFAAEESVLFPAFEERTGMRTGPTQVMRGEHVQMRALMDAALQALQVRDEDDYSGHAETLLIMMQQHNTKEENVLYPLCDQQLAAQVDTVVAQLQQHIHSKAASNP